MKAETFDERYYRHAGSIGIARRVSHIARMRVHNLFMNKMRPLKNERILDIGTSDDTENESNMLEQLYPCKEQSVAPDPIHAIIFYTGIGFSVFHSNIAVIG